MKRNSKFLLLLALIMSGIIGVYFLGCDEETVNNPIADEDKVIGSVHGVASDGFDNTPLPNVLVSWVSNGETRTVTTDSLGYFVTDDVLGSGEYEFTFSVNGYCVCRTTALIPTLDSLRGRDPDVHSGDIPYSRELNAMLFSLNSQVTGKLYTALPAPKKESEDVKVAGDSSDLVSPVAGIEVILEYGWDIVPYTYRTFTNQDGEFTFMPTENVPWAPSNVWLTVPPFTVGDSSYSEVTVSLNLVHGGTTQVPNIYAPLDCSDIPQILRKNFDDIERFHYDSTLKVTFSEPMDTSTAFSVYIASNTTYNLTWSMDNQVLEINPTLSLKTDTRYEVELSGKSQDGCPTSGRTWVFDFVTLDGIDLVSTNLERAPNNFTEFPIDSPIVLVFNMTPVINPVNGELILEQWINYPTTYYRVDIDSLVVGDTLVITPDNPLERDNNYRLTYKMYSSIWADYVSGHVTFSTEFDTIPPDTVKGFVLDEVPGWTADWDTKSIDFQWETVSNATGYRIYAKDNKDNTDFIVVGNFDQKDYLTHQEGTVTLPKQFDLYDDDGIQTPFSDGTEITFDIRAYNQAGEGPFTVTDAIAIADETAPNFYVTVCGDADNFVGSSDSVLYFEINGDLEYCEGTNNPIFVFTEAGGDSAYVLDSSAGSWTWDTRLRNVKDSGLITVPMQKCAAGDYFILEISDNSGNVGVDDFRLKPYIDFITPSASDTNFEAPSSLIDWAVTDTDSGCGTYITSLDLYISWDSGATWIDTLSGLGGGSYVYPLPDTLIVDGTALIGIENSAGGFRWLSELFTVNGVMLTSPDSASYFATTDTILDAGNTDSTLVPLAWNSTSFISEVVVSYYDNVTTNWNPIDTIANTGTYDFYAPSLGQEYNCWLRVADADNGRPRDETSWYFHVFHDTVIYVAPLAGQVAQGGSIVYNIRWNNGVPIDTLPSILDIYYAVDATIDTNWLSVVAGTENDGFHTWDTVPYASPSTAALIKIEAQDGTEYISDFFTISGLKITSPVGGEDWDVGSVTHIITWNNIGGFSGNVDVEYYNGTTWSSIASNIPNIGFCPWIPIPNSPTDQALVRVKENGGLITDTSDSTFTIAGIIVTDPNAVSDRWLVGRADTVKWNVIPVIGDTVGIVFSIDNGANYDDTLTLEGITNSGLFAFTVPATLPGPFPYTQCRVRVYDKMGGGTAADTSDANFTIDQPHITVTAPNGTETWQMGTPHNITWDTVGLRAVSLVITLDTSSGADNYPILIDTVAATTTSYSWTVPNLGLNDITTCRVRVAEVGYPLKDESDADFTISH